MTKVHCREGRGGDASCETARPNVRLRFCAQDAAAALARAAAAPPDPRLTEAATAGAAALAALARAEQRAALEVFAV